MHVVNRWDHFVYLVCCNAAFLTQHPLLKRHCGISLSHKAGLVCLIWNLNFKFTGFLCRSTVKSNAHLHHKDFREVITNLCKEIFFSYSHRNQTTVKLQEHNHKMPYIYGHALSNYIFCPQICVHDLWREQKWHFSCYVNLFTKFNKDRIFFSQCFLRFKCSYY